MTKQLYKFDIYIHFDDKWWFFLQFYQLRLNLSLKMNSFVHTVCFSACSLPINRNKFYEKRFAEPNTVFFADIFNKPKKMEKIVYGLRWLRNNMSSSLSIPFTCSIRIEYMMKYTVHSISITATAFTMLFDV